MLPCSAATWELALRWLGLSIAPARRASQAEAVPRLALRPAVGVVTLASCPRYGAAFLLLETPTCHQPAPAFVSLSCHPSQAI